MACDWAFKSKDRALFPLKTVGQVRRLFEAQLARPEPNLALLSIVAGYVENTLTACTTVMASKEVGGGGSGSGDGQTDVDSVGNDVTAVNLPLEPAVSWDTVETLMTKFNATIRGFCDPKLLSSVIKPDEEVADGSAKRKLVKHIADIIWNTLTKSQYKDRPHLQSIYSYLTGKISFKTISTVR